MARQLRRATLLAPFMLLAGFLALSCFDNTTGPRTFQGQFALAPQFESSVAGIVTIDRFRVLLRRTSDNSVALDTVITVVPGTDSVDLSLSVPMLTSSETFLLTLSLITPAGDTAFQAGPTTVTPSSTGGAPPAIPLTVVYVGVGAEADSVRIVTLVPSVFFGDTAVLVAEALDGTGTVISGTPIAWGSLDTLRARVANATEGKAVGQLQRGTARITATLLTGPADTVGLLVQPKPVRTVVESGDNQSAQVATPLAQPVRVRVKAADSLGVSGLKVTFSVVSGGGLLTPDSAVTNDSGRVDVQWKLGPTSGPQAMRAAVEAAFADSVVTAAATALAGPVDSLTVNDGAAQTAAAGAAVATAPSVVVRDSLNNPVPGVVVTFAVTAGGGNLTGATPTTDANGVARVGSWTVGPVAGLNTLKALVERGAVAAPQMSGGADGPTPGANAAGDTLAVTFTATGVPGDVASLAVAGINSPITAGLTSDVTVTAQDALGNVVPGYLGTVHFTSSDPLAVLPADYTFMPADGGIHTFTGGVKFLTDGDHSVTATDLETSSITGSQPVTVLPGIASPALSIITVSSSTVASGSSVTLTLQAKDASGNNLVVGGAAVVFTAGGGTSTGAVGTTTDNGDGTYTATFTGSIAGTATTIGAIIDGSPVTSTLPTVTVIPGAASPATSVVTVSQASILSGGTSALTLQAKDAAGNNLTAGGLTVGFSASEGEGISTGTISATTDNGNGTYSATFTGVAAGTATTIGATIGGNPVTTTLPTITVAPGSASLATSTVSVSSGTVASGGAVTLTLQAKDDAGNNLTGGGLTVVFSASQGEGISTGTISPSPATDNGDGTYSATFTGVLAGTPTTIGATIDGNAVTSTLPTIEVMAGAAATLVFTSQPTNTTVNATLPPVEVTAQDAAGNTATGFTGTVTVLITGTPPPGFECFGFCPVLSGTTTATAVNGIATLSGLSIDLYGSNYTLTATSGALTQDVSQPFIITPAGMTHLWTGAADVAFANAANWAPAEVPSSPAHNVFIPASAAFQPTVAAALTTLGDVIVEGGATLTLETSTVIFSAAGDVDAGNTIGGAGMVEMTGAAKALKGTVPNLHITGDIALSGPTNVTGKVRVAGFAANLTLAGNILSVADSFVTDTAGTLTMTSLGDELITQHVVFGGGSTAGKLTEGLIHVTGNFTQGGLVSDVASFAASGAHTLLLGGTTVQEISFATPTDGRSTRSHFQHLQVTNTSTAQLVSGVWVAGDAVVLGGTLDIGSNAMTVAGNFATAGTGTLTMTEPVSPGMLTVVGDAAFAGGSESGLLSTGVLRVAGDFTQLAGASTGSFEGASLHVTELNGSGPQFVSFQNPNDSHFGNLLISNTSPSSVFFATAAFAAGQLQTPSSAGGIVRPLVGSGDSLRVFGLDVDSTIFDNLRLVVVDGSPVARFDYVTFQNMDPTRTQLAIRRSGALEDAVFDSLRFLTTPNTGIYLEVQDVSLNAVPVAVFLPKATPLDGSNFTNLVAGGDGAEAHWSQLTFAVEPTSSMPNVPISPAVIIEALDPFGQPLSVAGDASIAIGNNPAGGVLSGTLTTTFDGSQAFFFDLAIDQVGSGYTLVASAGGFVPPESQPFSIVPGILFAGDSASGLSSGVFRANPDGSKLAKITAEGLPASDQVFARWSPDRTRITYGASPGFPTPDQLHVASVLGDTVAHAVTDAAVSRPRFSPDGKRLAFECSQAGTLTDACVLADVAKSIALLNNIGDGLGRTVVTAVVPTRPTGPPSFAWNPFNSNELAVVRDSTLLTNDVASAIYLVGFDGSFIDLLSPAVMNVGKGALRILGPIDWSGDGAYITFSAQDPTGAQLIYVLNVGLGTVSQVTNGTPTSYDFNPVFSPDAGQILFFGDVSCSIDYYVVNRDGSGRRAVTSEGFCDLSTSDLGHDWSPDGSQIVLVGSAVGYLVVYVVPSTVDAGNYASLRVPLRLPDITASLRDIQPSWRP